MSAEDGGEVLEAGSRLDHRHDPHVTEARALEGRYRRAHLGSAGHLGQHQHPEARAQGRDVGSERGRGDRVRAHGHDRGEGRAGVGGCQDRGDAPARGCYVAARDAVLEVEDSGIGRDLGKLGYVTLGSSGHEQPASGR